MLDPGNELIPPSSPTISSVSSSDLDTESTGSFFHDRSTTLGTLMGVTFPAIALRAPSQHRREPHTVITATAVSGGCCGSRKSKKPKKHSAAALERRRQRRWWSLCRDDEAMPSSLGEFLEVERRFGDGVFLGATAELEAAVPPATAGSGRILFADGRVLPPAEQAEEGPSGAAICTRFPVSLAGICSGGVG
ncbi:hypothetical protein RJ641_014954 [Dillenia turbinata]|uniref:Uncharacterized protein n=1 Tax=Dillenia turbinata TaxID=194707 RepID=A0AAN8V075_9MAGN